MEDKKVAGKAKQIQKKTIKTQNKTKEPQKKARKILNKTQKSDKKAIKPKKAKIIKGVAKKVIKVEKDKEIKKKANEAEKKAREAKKRAQEEVKKRALEEEKKFKEAEKRIREAEKNAREVEMTRIQEAEKKSREAKKKVIQKEKNKAKEVEIKTKEEMKIMEEEKKPMNDAKKVKEAKVKTKEEEKKPMEEQRTTIESPADFSPPTNNNGRTAVFISLIALAVAFFNFFTPPASAPTQTQKVDLGGIEDNIKAVSSSVKKMNSRITQNRKLLDSQIASSAEKFEQQKSETDKMYLTSGFTELVKGMQPSLGIYCKRASVSYIKLSKTAKSGTNTVAVDCNFNNNGRLKANIVPGSLILIGGKAQKVIDNAIERIDNGEETAVLPGKSNEKQYHIVLTEAGAANMKGGVMKMSFQAYTDKAALGMIKRKTNKEVTGEQLKELTKKNHMFSFLLKTD